MEKQFSQKVLERAAKLLEKDEKNQEKAQENATKYAHAHAETIEKDEAAQKFSVEITCTVCGERGRRVYTSDLWQVNKCTECTSKARSEARKAKAEELKEAREYLKAKREAGE